MSNLAGLLVKVSGDGSRFADDMRRSLGVTGGAVETILTVPASATQGLGLGRGGSSTWMRVGTSVPDLENPWDRAHATLDTAQPFSIGALPGVEAVEPDLPQQWITERSQSAGSMPAAADVCGFDDQDKKGRKAPGPGPAWSLGDQYSQLQEARTRVGEKLERILIAHLDTGYDPGQITLPRYLKHEWERNFVSDGHGRDDASDHAPQGDLLASRGHGTGTLSLLAGNMLDGSSPGWGGYTDFVGGAPFAQILPIRIADWVVRFTTGTLVQGFGYACEKGARVLSMSMGGFSSQALADAVNLAYDFGVVMVTAAGNNFAGVLMPKTVVYPARFRRVLAACGVMADGRPYSNLELGTMQGNFGPASKMDTALGAFTPNVPWAQIDCGKVVDMDGAGTSAATPQIAAAAALWLAEHWDIAGAYSEPWMRVEAVRHALFTAASKSTPRMSREEAQRTLGQGVMRAREALDVAPLSEAELRARKLPPARSTLGWLDGVFGGGVSLAGADEITRKRPEMLALELTQMAQRIAQIDEAIGDPDLPEERISAAARNRYLEAALDLGNPSKPLRAALIQMLGREPMVPAASVVAPSPIKRKVREPGIPHRRLRVYALDPSVAKSLASVAVNECVLSVPWDDAPLTKDPLQSGPVGEYLEVVDIDSASNRIYEPVDLNAKMLLAQDGWPPSEGNPQFHQQMVYAVAMTTIRQFEQALGRRALWAPRFVSHVDRDGKEQSKAYEVPRLRIYPHAFRGPNAYYSPEKKALLFGYFQADSRDGDATAPGSMVFSCLSSDIIAHEMSHALLDGLHRRFQDASNPDVPAFHEAFADIVALFQHFTVTELVRFEIARARGKLTAMSLLGGLAKQFGEGGSRRGPLRNYTDPAAQGMRYEDTLEPHDRGSILVFAVYESFLNIVNRRVGDLLRIASNGTGILPKGALHPDLVNRLADETSKTAGHVLRMCIRALDYAPPVDITFGEYLRALITADIDHVPDDVYGYRTAFMEAFRNRGILPRDMRTISEESLAWGTLDEPRPPWLKGLLKGVDLSWDQGSDRSAIFARNEKNRWILFDRMKKLFANEPSVYRHFGLVPDVPRYDRFANVTKTPPLGETTFEVHGLRPARRVCSDGTFRTEFVAVITQRQAIPLDGKNVADGFYWFRGGATLILDPRPGNEKIRYVIVKNGGSTSRQARQKHMAMNSLGSPLHSLYFGRTQDEPFAIMHGSHEVRDHG
ncbi:MULTISPECIES: S8 family serine peptidase [Sinorhizobium]|uniref:S8 family serine peptidase n=1 Tax=Sinorhizobium TaxID=28105 RepID=UPI001F2526F1|nr:MULTISPECIES: S8 family serine peptidase [Sinorhizobium]